MTDLPGHARTVIIGGGVIGCSIAYHLAREGRKDILLLERSKLTSGTTWHAAGHVRRLRPTATQTKLIDLSIDLYSQLKEETGQETGWLQTGSLSIATRDDRLTMLKRQVSLGHAFGLEAEMVDANATKDLWPLLRTDDVIGAVWSPADGRVNPSDASLALSKGAKARGVQIFENTRVTGLRKVNSRISGVEIGEHLIEAEEVVIACGLWSREVAHMVGANMPLYACEHFYILTKPIAEVTGHLPMLNDHDSYIYARDDVGGLLVGAFEPDAKALPLDRLPADFSFDLLEEDWDHFMPMMDNALYRIPILHDAEVRLLLNGPESFTLDSQFIIGESPEVSKLFLLGGMNSSGVSLAGGAGQAMAEWIISGYPTMDLTEVDIRRFSPEMNVLGALEKRIPEVLGRHYEISYPGNWMDSARGQRRSPIHEGLRSAGARFTARSGWERVEHFGGDCAHIPLTFGPPAWREQVAGEVESCRCGAAIIDQSSYGKVLVQGPDACSFLNYVCTAQLDISPGRIVYTPILNSLGGIESDVTVQRHDLNTYLMITGSDTLVRIMMYLRANKKTRNVEITDVSSAWAIFGLAGSQADTVLQIASSATLPNLKPFQIAPLEVGLARGFAGRLSYTGQSGYELYIPSDMAMTAYETLVSAGVSHAGMQAVTSLRIESGFRAWGHELLPTTTPVETGLERFVSLDTDFIGKESLDPITPPKRRIATLLFDTPDGIPIHDEPIWFDGKVVGQITSSAWNYKFNRSSALAMLSAPLSRLEQGEIVSGFEVEIACTRHPARASLAPLKSWNIE